MPPPEPKATRNELDRIHDAIEELTANIQQLKVEVAKMLATCGGCQHRIDTLEDNAKQSAANDKISVRSVGWLIGIIGTLIGTIGGAIAMAIGRTPLPPNGP